MEQKSNEINNEVWNQKAYDAWIYRLGTPEEAVKKIKKNPISRLANAYDYFGDVKGKKIINLLGSHGSKAVALALLGAKVTVVDVSKENARYADELAKEANVELRYIVSDVLKLQEEELNNSYDFVFTEFGILHYFTDLSPFMEVISKLLKKGGKLILQDFHPVTTKLITSRGTTHKIRKHKVTGDYFDTSLQETDVAYSKYLSEEEQNELKKVLLRKWNLGEIVTAVAEAGLFIKVLKEEPNLSSEVFDKGIPKTFTIVAEKL